MQCGVPSLLLLLQIAEIQEFSRIHSLKGIVRWLTGLRDGVCLVMYRAVGPASGPWYEARWKHTSKDNIDTVNMVNMDISLF